MKKNIFLLSILFSRLCLGDDTWQTIQESILNPKCIICHVDGTSFAEQSGLILTEDIAYEELINVTPTNIHAAEKIRRYGALWQCVYAISWLSALQLYTAATGMLIFTITSAIVIALVKEATGATGKPISWRR